VDDAAVPRAPAITWTPLTALVAASREVPLGKRHLL
jgi:hypothetical protein